MNVTDTVTMTTIGEFIESNRIVSGSYRVDANPNMEDSRNMDHWKVTLVRKVLREGFDTWHGYKGKLGAVQYSTRKLTVYFSKGYDHHGAEPQAAEVLSCLADDAAGVEYRGFEEWCSDYGYETDSRKAEKTFKACKHIAARLQSFLGVELFDQLVYHTERE